MTANVSEPIAFQQNIVMIGFGSIGQATLPLLFKHLSFKPSQVTILTKKEAGREIAEKHGVNFKIVQIDKENFQSILQSHLKAGDFLLNLSVDVSSLSLIHWCRSHHVLYLDTCIEPWSGGYTDHELPLALRSNYALRESVMAVKTTHENDMPTAVIAHGANPGLVSHFVKKALLNIAEDNGLTYELPDTQAKWAALAQQLAIKVIHIAERDTQVAGKPKRPNEFVNTWSIDGFIAEGGQPAELGWGTHEKHWPHDGNRHEFGCQSAIYLSRPGASTRVRTWTPLAGQFHGFLITHNESISIADYFTLKHQQEIIYRPTVNYAYHPSDDAVLSLHELAGREWQQQENHRLLCDEIVDGIDELGVLLMGNHKGAYWFGSQLSIHEARELMPYNTATSLQVAVGVLSGMMWAIENPTRGIVESDEIDHQYILSVAKPYLGNVVGHYTDWTPLKSRKNLFPETVDQTDPWQFVNMRVI